MNSLQDYFDDIDTDGTGEIDESELEIAMKRIGVRNCRCKLSKLFQLHVRTRRQHKMTISEAREMIKKLDTDGNGTFCFKFLSCLSCLMVSSMQQHHEL
jgi:Ca2+-binding EF-hand superfamily protein